MTNKDFMDVEINYYNKDEVMSINHELTRKITAEDIDTEVLDQKLIDASNGVIVELTPEEAEFLGIDPSDVEDVGTLEDILEANLDLANSKI